MSSSFSEDEPEVFLNSFMVPDTAQHTKRVLNRKGLREFLIMEHTANVRKGNRISSIWLYEDERRRIDDKSMYRYWRCKHCTRNITVLKVEGGKNG
jgi:hypothetical protein